MVKLIGNFSRLDKKKVLVAGDLLLDTYTIGKARRISPEAPVAVIEVKRHEERAGGAGNAILNLISLGAEVVALGRVGQDAAGKTLIQSLRLENVNTEGVIEEPNFATPIKNRIVADNQQIVRVDHETIKPLSPECEEKLITQLPFLLEGIQAIAISDYGKGFLSEKLLKKLILLARSKNIFIIVDPKGNDFSRYNHANLIKPNAKEAYQAAHLDASFSLDEVAEKIFTTTGIEYLMVTRSEEGISLFEKNNLRHDFPVVAKQVKDVTGAGDTVLAMLALSLANALPLSIAIQFSNVAAGIAIEQFGCARVSLPELAKRLLEFDISNKIFDADHLHALKASLANQPCSLVSIQGPPSISLIHRLTEHKKATGRSIVASITGPVQEETLSMVTALQPIDFILLNTDSKKILSYFPTIHFI